MMATKADKEKKKLEQERLQAILNQLLREDDNKYCADCDAKGPRWASWNLGVFLCIRCAGIHRNLGVHVSKVKSVNLDSWTPEQVAYMQLLGNSVARGVYEANIPEVFRRPQTDSALEAFIRAKYEQKRYIMKDWQPPRIDPNNLPVLEDPRHRKQAADAKTAMAVPPPPAAVKQQISPASLKTSISGIEDLMTTQDLGQAPLQKVSAPQMGQQSSNVDDLLGLGDFVSAPLPLAVSVAPAAPMMQNASASNDLLGLNIGSSGGGLLATHTAINSQSSPNLLPLATPDGFSAPPQPQHPQDDISLMGANSGSSEKRTNSDILALFGAANPAPPSGGVVMPGFYSAAAAAPLYNPYSMYPAQGANVYGANPMMMTGQYTPAGGYYQQPAMGVAYQQQHLQQIIPPQPQQAQFGGYQQSAEQYQQMQSQFAGLQVQGGGAVMTGAPSAQSPVSTMSMNLWQ